MLFVPALIFVMHELGWLHVIDDYAFVAIANNAAIADLVEGRLSGSSEDNAVVVALIDSETHAQRYSARSPLNRCELLKDISLLYDARPEVLAIDIDISPAAGLSRSRSARRQKVDRRITQGDCEDELYRLIKARNLNGTRTVLMAPARPITRKLLEGQCAWQADMRKSGVEFGGADLRVNNGMTLEQYDDERGAAGRSLRGRRFHIRSRTWPPHIRSTQRVSPRQPNLQEESHAVIERKEPLRPLCSPRARRGPRLRRRCRVCRRT